MMGEGGYTAVPQYADRIGYTYLAISGKHRLDTFKAEYLEKVSPPPPLILYVRH
jgi:hypothetical protein